MRTLYHFQYSPFSRCVRLALAHKGLEAELRECRDHHAWLEEARRLAPFRTIPILVDGPHVMGDSMAILHWLDRAYPHAPLLWPTGAEADGPLQVAALVHVALNAIVDLGTRYFALRDHASWPAVKGEMLGRAQAAADALAQRVASLTSPNISPTGWSAADIALLTMTIWCESWPGRAATSPNIAQVVTLGFRLPAELSRWADRHRRRPDVLALG